MRTPNDRGSAPLFVVMMAAAFGILIAYGLAKLTSASGLMSKSAQYDGDIDRITREINGVLADPQACPKAFTDATDTPVSVDPATAVVTVNRIYAGVIASG